MRFTCSQYPLTTLIIPTLINRYCFRRVVNKTQINGPQRPYFLQPLVNLNYTFQWRLSVISIKKEALFFKKGIVLFALVYTNVHPTTCSFHFLPSCLHYLDMHGNGSGKWRRGHVCTYTYYWGKNSKLISWLLIFLFAIFQDNAFLRWLVETAKTYRMQQFCIAICIKQSWRWCGIWLPKLLNGTPGPEDNIFIEETVLVKNWLLNLVQYFDYDT